MKLLQKTNQFYLLFSGGLLLLAGCFLYFMMTKIIDKEINDKLLINQQRIARQIKSGNKVESIIPIIEVEKLNSIEQQTTTIKDTNLYDKVEEDIELFREIRTIENINDTGYKITVRQVMLEPHDYLNSIGTVLGIVLTPVPLKINVE